MINGLIVGGLSMSTTLNGADVNPIIRCEAQGPHGPKPPKPQSLKASKPQSLKASKLKGLATRMINPTSVRGDGERAWVAVQREVNQEMS